jgi:YidC/Oxa1 family membrane protein insertase
MEKSDYGLGTDEADIVNDVSYIAYKQHFFAYFIDRRTIRKAELFSNNLVNDEQKIRFSQNNLKRLFL